MRATLAAHVTAAAAALLVLLGSASAASCGGVSVKLSATKIAAAGRKMTASALIKNTGSTSVENLYFQFELPNYLLPLAAGGSALAVKTATPPVLDGRFVYFRQLSLKARKSLRLKVTVGVPTCQSQSTVQLKGLAYGLDTFGNITCTSPATPVTTTVVRKAGLLKAKHAIRGNCTTPTPTGPYALIGTNTRCIEAQPLETFENGNGGRRRALVTAEDHRRVLVPTVSAAELQCWSCCGAALDATEPFYFNVGPDGRCYCCAECSPVYAPAWTAFGAQGRAQWTGIGATNNTEKWVYITGSADGSMLLAAANTWLWRSTDSGVTWSKLAGTNLGYFISVRCSDAGTLCVAATGFTLAFQAGQLFRSTDGGDSWSPISGTTARWQALWCNPSGTTFIASAFSTGVPGQNGWLWKSTDSGASFNQISGSNIERWGAAACDASATKCMAVASQRTNSNAGSVYISSNGLQTLTKVTSLPDGNYFAVAVSADGEKIIVPAYEIDEDGNGSLDGPGFVYFSDDGGQNFVQTNAPLRYYYVVSCDAAFKMCAVSPNGDIDYNNVLMQTSCDGGRTWAEDPGTLGGWTSTKVNADGGMMFATTDSPSPKRIFSYPLPVV